MTEGWQVAVDVAQEQVGILAGLLDPGLRLGRVLPEPGRAPVALGPLLGGRRSAGTGRRSCPAVACAIAALRNSMPSTESPSGPRWRRPGSRRQAAAVTNATAATDLISHPRRGEPPALVPADRLAQTLRGLPAGAPEEAPVLCTATPCSTTPKDASTASCRSIAPRTSVSPAPCWHGPISTRCGPTTVRHQRGFKVGLPYAADPHGSDNHHIPCRPTNPLLFPPRTRQRRASSALPPPGIHELARFAA